MQKDEEINEQRRPLNKKQDKLPTRTVFLNNQSDDEDEDEDEKTTYDELYFDYFVGIDEALTQQKNEFVIETSEEYDLQVHKSKFFCSYKFAFVHADTGVIIVDVYKTQNSNSSSSNYIVKAHYSSLFKGSETMAFISPYNFELKVEEPKEMSNDED